MAGHQPATVQTIALGADRDGKLTGIRHDSVNPTSLFDDYVEYAAMASRHLWRASGGISTSHRVVHVNRNTPVVLRAPMEAQGHFALESAMDELAYADRRRSGRAAPAQRRRRPIPIAAARSPRALFANA